MKKNGIKNIFRGLIVVSFVASLSLFSTGNAMADGKVPDGYKTVSEKCPGYDNIYRDKCRDGGTGCDIAAQQLCPAPPN